MFIILVDSKSIQTSSNYSKSSLSLISSSHQVCTRSLLCSPLYFEAYITMNVKLRMRALLSLWLCVFFIHIFLFLRHKVNLTPSSFLQTFAIFPPWLSPRWKCQKKSSVQTTDCTSSHNDPIYSILTFLQDWHFQSVQ